MSTWFGGLPRGRARPLARLLVWHQACRCGIKGQFPVPSKGETRRNFLHLFPLGLVCWMVPHLGCSSKFSFTRTSAFYRTAAFSLATYLGNFRIYCCWPVWNLDFTGPPGLRCATLHPSYCYPWGATGSRLQGLRLEVPSPLPLASPLVTLHFPTLLFASSIKFP